VTSVSNTNVTTLTSTFNNVHQRLTTGAADQTYQFAPATGSTAYGTANADDTYPTVASATLTYDANRNVTFDGANTLTYDVENRLIQAVSGGVTTTYLYDPLGHRKQKTVGTTVTQTIFDGDDEIADFPSAGASQATLTVRGIGGEPLASIPVANFNSRVFYVLDGTGSAIATLNRNATVADSFTYGPFGEPNKTSGVVYRFAGTRLDAETGLYYARARMYDPAIGRFLQTDPIGLRGGTNLYAYVGNDAINLTDPRGLDPNASSGNWSLTSVNTAVQQGLSALQSNITMQVVQDAQTAIQLGNSFTQASSYVALGATGVTVIGAASFQPEIVAAGGAGGLVALTLNLTGLALQIGGNAVLSVQQQNPVSVERATERAILNVLPQPPTVGPAIDPADSIVNHTFPGPGS
jgi:RHS repeat-associated protein